VDESGRCLLFRGGDPARPEAGTWWFPPGGAVEPGESVADSARRELREETGLDVQDLGPIVLRHQVEYEFERVHYSQDEAYFLVRCDHFEVSDSGWTPGERQVVEEHRWWSLDELRTTAETVYPVGLVALLEDREESHPRPLYKIDDSHRIRIEAAADHLDLIPTIAGWHWAEWGHADSDGSVESWGKALAARTNRDRVPATWIAMSEDQPVGAVSLVEHDMPDRPDLAAMSPWLAGLYVVPTHRRLGIATQLVTACESGALRMGIARVYLYSSRARLLYERLGWERLADDFYEGEAVTIMAKDLNRADLSGEVTRQSVG
jgi:8-oxo-dGTP pyrophosphatase MutT (NUDIX family)/predicted N-acetyltransferase YhbS